MKITLADLEDEMAKGRIWACSLRDPKWHLDGLQSGQDVMIDERPAVVETLLHELLHRRYRAMSERSVTRTARRLLAGMDDREKSKWWRAYQRMKRTRRPVDVHED